MRLVDFPAILDSEEALVADLNFVYSSFQILKVFHRSVAVTVTPLATGLILGLMGIKMV